MSKRTSYLLGVLFTIILGTLLYCYLCDGCYCYPKDATDTEAPKEVEQDVKIATKNPFLLKDPDGDFSLDLNENFNFKDSRINFLEPLSADIAAGSLRLKDYLASNPLKNLNITGYYTSGETNDSPFPNLGLARANAVKNYFVSLGVPSRSINTFGALNDGLVPDDQQVYYGPLSFEMTTNAEDANDQTALKQTCDAIKDEPLVLYFETGEAAINLTDAQRQKFADILNCVDKLGLKIQIIGHTDNTGDAANNMVLGQQRADFAKNYLVRNGVMADQMETLSKGQDEPIADNATEEGKSKNRRTVVTLN